MAGPAASTQARAAVDPVGVIAHSLVVVGAISMLARA